MTAARRLDLIIEYAPSWLVTAAGAAMIGGDIATRSAQPSGGWMMRPSRRAVKVTGPHHRVDAFSGR
jgi:hypothetical protein